MGLCVCVEPVVEFKGEREEKKMTVGKPRKMGLKNGWKEMIKKG